MGFAPGTTFDRYIVEELLGIGGMGEVYRALDTRLRRRVALKILQIRDEDSAKTVDSVAAMMREARAAAALDHPNVVSVFDLGEHEGTPYLAMELVVGRPLRTLIGHPDVPVEQRLRWLVEIAKALAAAHRAGVIHRDIKPENVMIREDAAVKVLDFGLARHASFDLPAPPPSDMAITQNAEPNRSRLAGTPAYIAPEQVRGEELDGRADQFAWGVVAYELLAGRLPWTGGMGVFELVGSVLRETPRPVRGWNPSVSSPVSNVVQRSLEKLREHRYANMDELLDALGAAEGKPYISSSLPAMTSGSATSSNRSGEPPVAPSDATVTIPGLVTGPISGRGSVPTPTPEPASSPNAASQPESKPAQAPDAPAPTPPARPARRRSRIAWGVAATFVCACIAVLMGSYKQPTATPQTPVSAAPPAPSATALLDLPAPAGCNAEATAKFTRGMHQIHDGNWEQAAATFGQATAADPECASAHFRLALTSYYTAPIAKTREIFRRAIELRASLTERDRALLDAFEPRVRRDPPDQPEYRKRLDALVARYPGDAEIIYYAGGETTGLEERIAAMDRAIQIDPGFSDALQELGRGYWEYGKTEEALKALGDCIDRVPNSVDCVSERITLLRRLGRCEEAVKSSRLWIARDPGSAFGHLMLANALASTRRPREEVEEVLRQRWALLAEPSRSQRRRFEEALLASLSGDFERAEQEARALAAAVEPEQTYGPHARSALMLFEILDETRREAEAADVAAQLLARRGAWPQSAWSDDRDITVEVYEPRLFHAAHRTGKLSDAMFKAARATWLGTMQHGGYYKDPHAIWAFDVAAGAETEAEAKEAVRARPPSTPAPHQIVDAWTGHALLLASHPDDALPLLRRGAAGCNALTDPFLHLRTHLWLGQALERLGDTAGACVAYRGVLERWGSAKRSKTAEAARKRLDALHCSP